jgi:PPOX class probable F420-dependent enzyme
MMSASTLDAFLRARRVAVLAIARDGRPPLSSPIWYDYDGQRFRIQVDAGGAKARTIARLGAAAVSLTVQSEAPPYRYAVAYGTATLSAGGDAGLRQRVARRYFGRIAGDIYVKQEEAAGRQAADLRIIEVVPDRFVTHDFGPEAGRFGRFYFGLYRWLRPVPA